MTNGITHLGPQANGARGVPAGAMDVWNQGAPGGGQLGMPMPAGPAAPPAASPVAMAAKPLRGRVALAVVLAGCGAVMGAAAGYLSQAPKWESDGLVHINPVTPLVEGDKPFAFSQQFMNSEAMRIPSPDVINEVPKVEPWKSTYGNTNAAGLADLATNLKCTFTRNTEYIALAYITNDQKLATTGVQSLINAYKDQYKNNNGQTMQSKLTELKRRIAEVDAQNDAANKTIDDITAKYGTPDLAPLSSQKESIAEDTERQLRVQQQNLQAATDAIESNRQGGNKISLEDLASYDKVLAGMVSKLRDAQLAEQLDEANLGPNHPKVVQEKINANMMAKAVDNFADDDRKSILAIVPDFGSGALMAITRIQYNGLQTRVASLQAALKAAQDEQKAIAADSGKIASIKWDMKKYQDQLLEMNQHLTTMQYAAAMGGDLSIWQDGKYASKAPDKKILFGLAGAMGGALVPVGLLMLLGLMDTRFRYSDDAAGHSMSGIPLLGILPNLPDRLSDPAQASIAAHCVHQIRTMLQLNAMREHSTVFSITSAASGDGKTSLSLALGLSFAASGSRTLLIDADLVGGGLTSRLGTDTAVGIVDALAGVGLEECVQPTDVADLSLLPIGSAQAHHAGSFSPPAVRKLLAEIRKHYEVIIIDTGPVMGSIEATPICASVDGVVLTVARGQSRPLVERAITHLQSIGAKVSGVVFNRAQHKDFEQSIGAISIRSAARSTMNGTGHNSRTNAAGMGAVANAVHAGNVTRES